MKQACTFARDSLMQTVSLLAGPADIDPRSGRVLFSRLFFCQWEAMCFFLDSVAAGALGISAAAVAAAGQSDDDPVKVAAATILQDCLQVIINYEC